MAEKSTGVAQQQQRQQSNAGQQQGLTRQPYRSNSPARMLDQFARDIEDVFDSFGFGGTSLFPRRANVAGSQLWAPDIDVFQKNNELVVRADLPGMNKDDIQIDVTENELTISGERHHEQESDEGGVYRSERSYGNFCRTIPLPEGTMTDEAKATFKDGVLEVKMPAPSDQVTRGRRLEIQGGESKK